MGSLNDSGRHLHPEKAGGEFLTYLIFEIVISSLAFFNNAMVLVAIYKFKNLRTRTYTLIGSLAAADIAVALVANPSGIALRKGLMIYTGSTNSSISTTTITQGSCSFFVCSVLIFTQVSIFNLLAIAVDRFIAIYHSLRYKAIVTRFRLRVTIAMTWISGAAIGSIPHIVWNVESPATDESRLKCAFEGQVSFKYMVYLNFFAFTLMPLVIMFILYYVIFRSAKRQLRKIYFDVCHLNKKTKSSLSSLKEIFKIKDQFQLSQEKKKKPSLRIRLFSSGNTKYDLDETSNSIKENTNEVDSNVYDKLSTSKDDSLSIITESSLKDSPFSIFSKSDSSLNNLSQSKTNLQSESRNSTLSLNSAIKREKNKSNLFLNGSLNGKAKSVSTNTISSTVTVSTDGTEAFAKKKRKLKTRSKYLKKEFRAARSLLTVVGVFAVCWLPLHIHNAIHYFNPSIVMSIWYADFAILLSHANSLVNPIIYAFKLSDMRVAFRKLFAEFHDCLKISFCCCYCRKRETHATNV